MFQVQLGSAWLGRRGSSSGKESGTLIYLGITATQEQNAKISPALIPAQEEEEEADPALRDGVKCERCPLTSACPLSGT